jgi:hypothetical protein
MHRVNNFFIFCSGSDFALLEKCSTEKNKYVGIGATVFFTGVFAAVSSSYALYTVFDNVFAAIFFGLIWGLMIFNLDRYIVSSMRKEARGWREFLIAIPRLILAILISIVIVKPLELKIFDKEIQPELVLMEQTKYTQQQDVVSARFASRQDSLKNELIAIQSMLAAKALKRDELVRIAQEEADGTGGSRKRNLGPIYKVKKADADRAETELTELQASGEERIKKLQGLIDASNVQLSKEQTSIERSKMNGPAARIEALNRLTLQSSAMAWAHWFIVLLFIAIETAPVFVKLISSKGPYDNLLRIEEDAYHIQETEILATTHADAKSRSAHLPDHEQGFLNDRLNASLKRS